MDGDEVKNRGPSERHSGQYKEFVMRPSIYTFLLMCVLGLGCGQQNEDDQAAVASVARAFLQAVKKKDARPPVALLTRKAQKNFETGDLTFEPETDPVAHRVGKVTLKGNRAEVSLIPIKDGGENPEVSLRLRKEAGKWRIYALAFREAPGSPVVVFDFENPNAMFEAMKKDIEQAMEARMLGSDEDAAEQRHPDAQVVSEPTKVENAPQSPRGKAARRRVRLKDEERDRSAAEAVSDLIKAVKAHPYPYNSPEAEHAIEGLKKLGRLAVPGLMEALKSNDRQVRAWAAKALGALGTQSQEAVALLVNALNDDYLLLRVWSAEALCKIGERTEVALPVLLETLNASHPFDRSHAIKALGEIGPHAKPALPGLIKALSDANSDAAADALHKLGPVAAPALNEALKRWDADVRLGFRQKIGLVNAARALRRIDLLTEALRDENSAVRQTAAGAIGRIGPEAKAAIPALIEALQDKDRSVQQNAMFALERMGSEARAAVPALIEVLKDMRSDVHRLYGGDLVDFGAVSRERAAFILGQIGPDAKTAIPALIKAQRDPDRRVREAATRALEKIQPQNTTRSDSTIQNLDDFRRLGPEAAEAFSQLIPALRDDDASAQRDAFRTLKNLGEEAVPALSEALKDERADVRRAAALALAGIGPPAKTAVPALVKALQDESFQVRASAAAALARIGPSAKAAVPALVKALEDESVDVRRASAAALGQIGSGAKAAIPALIEALSDEDEIVRVMAVGALLPFGPEAKSAVPALIEALEDKNGFVRAGAVGVLGAIGPEAKASVPALRKALNDKSRSIRQQAAGALQRIERQNGE